jgi:hypothetical protein
VIHVYVVSGIQRRVDSRSGRGRDAVFLSVAEASANQYGRDNRWKYNSCSHRIVFVSFEKSIATKKVCPDGISLPDKPSPESPGVDCASFFTQRCAP